MRSVVFLLFGILLPAEKREEILWDLWEEREERARADGPWRFWLLGQMLAVVAYGLFLRPLEGARALRGRGRARHGGPGTLGPMGGAGRFVLRSLARRPGYATLVVVTLGLGTGATTSLFSVVYGAVLRPLPFPEAERLLRFGERGERAAPDAIWSLSVANFLDLKEHARSLEGMAAYSFTRFNLSGHELPERVRGLRVTHDFFEVLGIPVAQGRGFVPEDDVSGADPVVLLSEDLWRGLFGGAPDVVGERINLDGIPHRIVGIAGGDFLFRSQVWVPFAWSEEQRANRNGRWVEGVARLAPGVSAGVAQEDLAAVFARLAETYPDANGTRSASARGLEDWFTGPETRRRVLLFGGASLLVLLIAFANVVNLGLARAEGRRRELALRVALGSGRGRLVGNLVVESLVLALAGGALGVVLAYAGTGGLMTRLGEWIPRATEVSVNGAVLSFALGSTVLVGTLVGLISAGRIPSGSLSEGIGNSRSDPSGDRSRVRSGMVVAAVALALVLLAGAGVLNQTVRRLGEVDMGVRGEGVVTFSFSLPSSKYPDRATWLGFLDGALESLAATPGVLVVGAQNRGVLSQGANGRVEIDGEAAGLYDGLVDVREVSSGYFDALGVSLAGGRGFAPGDRDAGGVSIVNAAFVREVIGDGPALGRTFGMRSGGGRFTIVGVVGDIRQSGPAADAVPVAYFPFGAGPWPSQPGFVAAVRAQGDPLALVPEMRRRIAELDPDVPLADITDMESALEASIGGARRMAALLFSIFSAVALLLAGGGVYSVMAYTVGQRRHEMGVRRALGATRDDLVRHVVGWGLKMTAVGLVVGLAGVAALGRALASLLYDAAATAPATVGMVALILLGVAALASFVPALRAGSVDPMVTLRGE